MRAIMKVNIHSTKNLIIQTDRVEAHTWSAHSPSRFFSHHNYSDVDGFRVYSGTHKFETVNVTTYVTERMFSTFPLYNTVQPLRRVENSVPNVKQTLLLSLSPIYPTVLSTTRTKPFLEIYHGFPKVILEEGRKMSVVAVVARCLTLL
ncbi:hypothetical protein J6590_002686 [Homalodisca vitripennis]|nr:hypothetical protein J6590_002686 [Homalodisca vitripennis]